VVGGKAILVPHDFTRGNAAPKAKAAAPKKAGESKTDKAVAMLLKGKSTRGDIAAAVEWPSIDLKALAKRKGLRLRKDADGVITGKAA
jgi:hypothetical protein